MEDNQLVLQNPGNFLSRELAGGRLSIEEEGKGHRGQSLRPMQCYRLDCFCSDIKAETLERMQRKIGTYRRLRYPFLPILVKVA